MYNYLLKNINNFLRFYYFDYYYKDNNTILNFNNILLKLDYFLYLRFYFMYLFLYYFKKKNVMNYSFLLNFQYTIGEICISNYKHYNVIPESNINFLNKTSIFLFDYLLVNEIYFNKNIININKMIIICNILLFQIGILINELYKKRLLCIKNNETMNNELNFLFLLPGFEDIDKSIQKTKMMNYSNFYFYLTIIFWILY